MSFVSSFVVTVLKEEKKVEKAKPKARTYGLYQKQTNNHWLRVSHLTGKKASCIRLFQNVLITSCLDGWPELRLRPIHGENETVGEIRKS